MGWDRIRYFEGVDGESTLISATGASEATVLSFKFQAFARYLGFKTREVVDIQALPHRKYLQNLVNKAVGAHVAEFPQEARRVWYGDVLAEHAIEFRPPVSEEAMKYLNAYLLAVCDPNDAGPLILDNRGNKEQWIAGS